MSMRGILLAGGLGTRLNPTTRAVNKHLIPIFDKPMIYYPLTTLMLANVREICIVSTESGVTQFKELLGDGSQWGMELTYAVQESAIGIADGISIGLSQFKTDDSVLVILGDNIFYGQGLGRHISEIVDEDKCMIWVQAVDNPESFGIACMDKDNEITSIVEKPSQNIGNMAITGLYYFPSDVNSVTSKVQKSSRGEKEITDVLNHYLKRKVLKSERLTRGVFWLDAGTVENLLEASQFVRVIQSRQGHLIGSPDEAAFQMHFITRADFEKLAAALPESSYKAQIRKVLS